MKQRDTSCYNRSYFAANKAAIIAKRKQRRASMTEPEREIERLKARERAARGRASVRELLAISKEMRDTLETLSAVLVEQGDAV